MCGITGIWTTSSEGAKERVERAVQSIRHRGPDFQSVKNFGKLTLGHARLSIIDPSEASHQAFVSEDGRYALVYNGEIYNFRELKAELVAQGEGFRTSGDTELLLKLLLREGSRALQKLNGFFAFAFYDTHSDYLLLARDRMGIKPLLYADDGNELRFGSELWSIEAMGGCGDWNRPALAAYLQLGYIPAPHTIYQQVHKLLPGQMLEWTGGKKKLTRYFELPCKSGLHTPVDDTLRTLMEESVRMRLIADRPLGCFLSGGVDSSIVTALAARERDGIDSFSVSFTSNSYLDESEAARKVAAHLGTRHHEIPFESHSLLDRLKSFLASMDEPFADSSAIAYLALCEYTSGEVKVALSGDGADELFGGYRKHRAHLMLQSPLNRTLFRLMPTGGGSREVAGSDLRRKLGRFSEAAGLNAADRYWMLASFGRHEDALRISRCDAGDFARFRLSVLSQSQPESMDQVLCADQELVLPNDMLHKADLMSMARGLEVRTPFMDHRVVQKAASIPAGQKLNYRKGKLPLRTEFADLLPEWVFARKKQGFEIPLSALLHQALKSDLAEVISASALEQTRLFDPESALQSIRSFTGNTNASNSFTVYAILLAQSWALGRRNEL